MGLRYNADAKGFRKSIKNVIKGFEKGLPVAMKAAGDTIAESVQTRFDAAYGAVSSTEAAAVRANVRASTPVIDSTGDLVMGVGNIEELDKATEVIAKGNGNTYHLWSLMEHGFGMKGGKRAGLYSIDPTEGKRALVFYMGETLVYATHVDHPGAEGRHFFMETSGNWYATDRDVVRQSVAKEINKVVDKASYKGK